MEVGNVAFLLPSGDSDTASLVTLGSETGVVNAHRGFKVIVD